MTIIKIPERISLANLPTRIQKLEFAVKEALDMGCDTLITCGGIQSNHARVTAAAAAKLGMNSCLVLRNDEKLHLHLRFLKECREVILQSTDL